MISIRRQNVMDADPDVVWGAPRDREALHWRIPAGFVTGCESDGIARIVTCSCGAIMREGILGCDEARRRLWSIVDGLYTHHNGAAEVLAEGDGRARLVWTSDLRPMLWPKRSSVRSSTASRRSSALKSGVIDPESTA